MKKEGDCYLLYVKLDPYVAQWWVNDRGGVEPVELQRESIESKILETYLKKMPPGETPDLDTAGKVAIIIPSFRHKPPRDYNWLTQRAEQLLQTVIRNRFDVALWLDLHKFGKLSGELKEIIYTWMDEHGIDEQYWDTVVKRYNRQRRRYAEQQRKKKVYKNRKNSC